jgi:hypothetical protein
MECAICFEVAKPFILPCNHSVCIDCYRNIELCPFCRKEIKHVTLHHIQIQVNDPFIEEPLHLKDLCSVLVSLSCLIVIVWITLGVGNLT